MCIAVVEIWFRIANGPISSFDRVICLPHNSGRVLLFQVFIFIEYQAKRSNQGWIQGLQEAGFD